MIAHKNSLKLVTLGAIVLVLLSVATSSAAPKKIAVQPVSILAELPGVEGMVVTETFIITISNIFRETSDIQIRALDFLGAEIWSKTIDSGLDEIATAFSADADGTVWLAGNSANLALSETETVRIADLNPDGIIVENTLPLREDMNNLTVWEISATGELLSTTSKSESAPALVDAISATSSGAAILKTDGDDQSIISLIKGKFGKEFGAGSAKTKINSIVRAKNGSTYAFGSSSETLGGKRLMGRKDGILLKFSKSGALSSVVRSSASKSIRDWQSATTNFFLTGSIKTGANIQSAITKFTKNFKPTWTTRIQSTGRALAVKGAKGSVYAILEAKTAVSGVRGWKPKDGKSIVLQFDRKGKIIGAFASSEFGVARASGFSSAGGLFILTEDEKLLKINN